MHPQPAATSSNKATRNVLPWLLALLLLVSAPFAFAKSYTYNTDGTVTDPSTGLTWMRCAMGQTWTGSTCSGEARTYTTCDQANALTGTVTFAGQSDWRVPNIRELLTIVDRTVSNPAIDSAAFPNTPGKFESSFYCLDSSVGYTMVSFSRGDLFSKSLGNNAVRMVRGGETFSALLSLDRPTSDYVDHGDGTVTHTPTRLTWKRCAEGQTWTGSTCSGPPNRYISLASAALTGTTAFAGKNDWRLPTEEELLSLVDYRTYDPAINSNVFPGTLSRDWLPYWSGSNFAGGSNGTWFVDFYTGKPDVHWYGAVRLVRAEKPSANSVPGCTLSANPTTIPPGASATLTVICNPAAASYTWSGGTCAGTTGATCTVTPMTTTTYTVTGANAEGISAMAAASVTVAAASTLQANSDGTVTDAKTGLTWMRCAMGQTWTGSTCSGEASTYNFEQANALTGTVTFAGQSDWRLPNIRELQTIMNWSVYSPMIDSVAFPNLPGQDVYFWLDTPSSTSYALLFSFYSQTLASLNGLFPRSFPGAVRLVRAGESFRGLLRMTRPTSDYVDDGDGTATHTPTRLTWKRCLVGQTWTGSTCIGEATTYTFEQANALIAGPTFAGQNDWRLPTEEELLSLVDHSLYDPAVNGSIFPWPQREAKPRPGVWSGTAYVDIPGRAWSVDFRSGRSVGEYDSYDFRFGGFYDNSKAVLLVRNAADNTTATTPPVCTLAASPVVIAAGGSATLRVSCTPAATSYGWINSGFGDATASGTVSPTATTLYGVVGRNAAGGGTIASAAVYVCNTPPVQNYSPLVPGGTAANDQLASSTANDSLDGAAGIDTVRYNCNRSNFTVTKTAAGWAVSSQAEGLDTLSNIERLRFNDETLALDVSGNAGQAYRLYQAAFNRTPDNDGLKYWIGQLDAGMALQEVAARFISSDEFRRLYGTSPSNADFLTRLYNNVLHRAPDATGYAWWLEQLNTGVHTRTTALMGFSESPENQAGVLNAIINGIDLLN